MKITSFIENGFKTPFIYLAKYNRNFLKIISPTPVDVSLKVTEKCNSRCITCNVWQEQLGKPELTIEDFEKIFQQLKEIKIKTIGLYGGEPLLREDIGEIIKKAKNIIKESTVSVVTNGLLLKDKAEELFNAGIDVVGISLDGIGEVNDKIRGISGHYQKVIEGIKELKKIDIKNKVKINIGTTLLSQNIHQILQLINLAKELGISWSFNLFNTTPYHFKNINSSFFKKIDDHLADEAIDYMYKARKNIPEHWIGLDPVGLDYSRKYLKGEKPPFYCILGYFRIYIDSYKNVYSGCWVLPPVGNLEKKSLKNILNSPEYKERLIKMYDLKCPYCTCGYLMNCLINRPFSGIRFLAGTFFPSFKK